MSHTKGHVSFTDRGARSVRGKSIIDKPKKKPAIDARKVILDRTPTSPAPSKSSSTNRTAPTKANAAKLGAPTIDANQAVLDRTPTSPVPEPPTFFPGDVFEEGSPLDRLRQFTMANSPEIVGGVAPVVGLSGKGVLSVAQMIKGLTNKKAITKALGGLNAKWKRIGTDGLNPKGKGLGKTFASNSKNLKTTVKWVGGIAAGLGLSLGVVSLYKDIVGTEIFTGFMGEETIQLLGLAVRTARDNEDWDNYQKAVTLNEELVTIMQSDEFITGLPYDEAVRAAKIFADAGELKNAIDQKWLDDKLIQITTGETEDEKFARIRQEEIDANIALNKLIDETAIARQATIIEMNKQASIAKSERERKAIEANIRLWEDFDREKRLLDEEDRIAQAEFWAAYNLETAKNRDNNVPSNLNFGLI